VRPGRWLFCTVFLACAGITIIVVSQHTHRWAAPPVPPTSIALQAQQPVLPAEPTIVAPSPPAAPASTAASAQAPRPRRELNPAPLRRSVPLTVRIPAIGVDARIIPLGLGPDDIVNVPPLTTPMLTSWFDGGVTPGQAGPAVLFGHVDSAVTGPAVFYRLGDLRPGNLVYVTRADHRTAVLQVDAVDLYSESSFPDTAIYSSTAAPVLRLITCGGQFDTQTHLYLDRTVAYARYLGQLR
jgi:sortase (surface protein transpeptidase)